MITNKEVCKRFAQGRTGRSHNLYSSGNQLVSYETTIVERRGKAIYFNATYYSRSTSEHQRLAAKVIGHACRILPDVFRNTRHLYVFSGRTYYTLKDPFIGVPPAYVSKRTSVRR